MILWLLACQLSSDPHLETAPGTGGSPPVVALITIDTWRADHLSPEMSPNVWALANEGERYTRAYSPMGLTTPAHGSMLTGLYPWEHGLAANNHHGYRLRPDVPVLPESFEGWARGAFVSAYPAGPEGGLERGWDIFVGPPEGERPGSVAVSAAMDWLPTDRPALLWVHVYEPHGPYVGSGVTERERYGAEVRRADALLGPLIDLLKVRGATIVVAADHGEVLDEERCSYQHERSISEHVLRVPLIRWGPGIKPAVSDAIIGLNDVPALLRGETPPPRSHWLAQSGMCESDCAPGCSPSGLTGRDTVVIDGGGRWVSRPGRGRFMVGQPADGLAAKLDSVPSVSAPASEANQAAKSLGYLEP
jgi:hypothetical protein